MCLRSQDKHLLSQCMDFLSLALHISTSAPDIKILNMINIPLPSRGDMFHGTINARRVIENSGQDKVLPITLRYLKVVFLKGLRKDDSREMYFCVASVCGSLAINSSILRCCNNVNLATPEGFPKYLPFNRSGQYNRIKKKYAAPTNLVLKLQNERKIQK